MRAGLLTGSIVLVIVAALVADARAGSGPSDVPAHHASNGFTNPGLGAHAMPSVAVTLPFFLRRAVGYLNPPTDMVPGRVANDGSFLRHNAEHSSPSVTWVGHSTLLVQMGGATFLTDPIWSQYASPVPMGPRRLVEPGLALDDLPPIDFVLISHNHYDHMDLPTLAVLAQRSGNTTPFFTPLDNAATLRRHGIERVIEMDWWERHEVAGVTVHCVPARHWSRRGLFDMNASLWSGWAVTSDERRFYFAGDTGMFDGFEQIGERLGPFDLAAVPIGAYLPVEMMAPAHTDPDEAIEAAVAVGARSTVAIHHGTFVLSDERFDEPPRRFVAASERAGRGPERDWVLKIGETRTW